MYTYTISIIVCLKKKIRIMKKWILNVICNQTYEPFVSVGLVHVVPLHMRKHKNHFISDVLTVWLPGCRDLQHGWTAKWKKLREIRHQSWKGQLASRAQWAWRPGDPSDPCTMCVFVFVCGVGCGAGPIVAARRQHCSSQVSRWSFQPSLWQSLKSGKGRKVIITDHCY